MKIKFLRKDPENMRLILIFTGWSTGPEVGAGIDIPGWDVAVAYDFTELNPDTSFLDSYYTVYLFGWSLGVFAASRTLPHERITAAFAVNGTTDPVDDIFGIPVAIYNGTAENLNERNLMKFRIRMMRDRTAYENAAALFHDNGDAAVIDNLRNQLTVIRDTSAITDINLSESATDGISPLPWVRAYISKNDRIFPPDNQKRAWSRDPDVEIVELDDAHYTDLAQIVRSVISDPTKVSRQFSKASVSYDTHAIAQYSAAIKLATLLGERKPVTNGSVLEIGCGTGLFTKEYAGILHPRRATFVDITATGPFGIAENEEYYIEDAERWIEKQTCAWDTIVSASAIQWFADIPRFLHLCARQLKDNGILAISTFLPGNMGELDELRPSPLLYPKADQLREWMERDFDDVMIREDCIKVEFRSAREMLMHLKHTGVAGSAPTRKLNMSEMSHLRSLTYRPVYVTGKKKKSIETD